MSLGVVAEHCPQIGWGLVHLDVQQEAAAAGDRQILGPGRGIAAGLQDAATDTLVQVTLGVVDHRAPKRFRELATGLHAAYQVGHQGCVLLDLGHRGEPGCRVAGVHRLGLTAANLLGDVVVAGLAQTVLGTEVVDDERSAHARRFGDRAQPDAEALLAEPLDRRVADPGRGGRDRRLNACSKH